MGWAVNVKAIRLFFHVMQRGSLSAAARELHMSQSAASRQLAGLERSTGLTLFSREGQRLRPTAEGALYFTECHRALAAIDELPRAARRLASGARPRLRLVSMMRFVEGLAVPAIGRFLADNPDVEIDLQLIWRADVERLIAFEQFVSPVLSFDVGLTTLPLPNPAIATAPLLELPATVILRRDHRLAGKASIGASDLAGERVAMPPTGSVREQAQQMFAAEGVEWRPQLNPTSSDIACQLVLAANAVTIADPLFPLAHDPEAFALVPVRPARMVRIGFFTPTLAPESRLVAAFKGCLKAEARLIEHKLAQRLKGGPVRSARRRQSPAARASR